MVIFYKIHKSYLKKYLGFLKVSSAQVITMSKTGRDLSTHTQKKKTKNGFCFGQDGPPSYVC